MQQRSLIPKLPLNEREVERALRVFKRLRIPDVIGTPTNGEVCAPWVFELVAAIFGAYDPATRRRMIREFFVLIPKKNGKSSLAAAIMVTAAIVNRRPAAELLLIAPTKKIASIAFNQAAGIIRLDAELNKLFNLSAHTSTIKHRMTEAVMQIKAADADVITGSKASYILVDETHEFAQKADAKAVFIEIRGGLASRPDGFMIQITTQSKDPPVGLFKAELNTARAVRDGVISLPILPVLYELPFDVAKDGGWRDPKTWPLVNPNLHRSVDEAYLRDELAKAERTDDTTQLQLIASQHFNVEVGSALPDDAWRAADYWADRSDYALTLENLIERSEVATIGIDGGGLDDMLGLAVIGREKQTRRWLIWNHAYAHPKILDRYKELSQTLLEFEAEGSLTFCQVPDDIKALGEVVAQIRDAGLLPEKNAIGFDPNNVGTIIEELVARRITDPMLRRLMQGTALSPAIWGIERKLSDDTLSHGGLALMRWVVGNAKVEVRGNGNIITKQAAGRAKIDPLIATFCAAILMSWNPVTARRQHNIFVI